MSGNFMSCSKGVKVSPRLECGHALALSSRGVAAVSRSLPRGATGLWFSLESFLRGFQYVMAAKQQVAMHDVAIDMPAGPSEVMVIADETSNPAFVAADLLSQAEHGVDSQVVLVTTSEKFLGEVEYEVQHQLSRLPRWQIAEKSLENSKLILVKDMDEAIEMANEYAPEHLIIETKDYMDLAEKVVNAGSVFLGVLQSVLPLTISLSICQLG